jgi:hypothetical protein
MRRLVAAARLALALGAIPAQAEAQRVQTRPTPTRPRPPVSAEPRALETTTDLRAHFGLDLVERLLRSEEPENRLRGIVRAASLGTPEAVARLIDIAEPSSTVRLDARALIEVARALAPSADKPATRTALVNLVNTPNPSANRNARTDDASTRWRGSKWRAARQRWRSRNRATCTPRRRCSGFCGRAASDKRPR